MAAIPPLAELDPERCYLSWEMVLTTSSPREAISDVFIFVEDTCDLTIQLLPDQSEESLATGAANPAPEATEDARASAGRRAFDKPDNASSIRVPATKLDQFVNLVGELVTVQARLGEIATRHDDPDVVAVSEEVERLTTRPA